MGAGAPSRAVISVIIPAHDEEALIGRTLGALARAIAAAGCEAEVIVVDDASRDSTGAIAEQSGARVVRVERRQIAAARNAGAAAARGDRLIFVDADTMVPPETLRATIDALDRGVVGGGAWVRFDGRVPAYVGPTLACMRALYALGGLHPGCYLFCTREAFEATGGFDESLFASEEVGFARALRRAGRCVRLRERTITSGRKLRAYTARELFGALLRMGRRGTRRREGLEIWYGPRRPDPSPPDEGA